MTSCATGVPEEGNIVLLTQQLSVLLLVQAQSKGIKYCARLAWQRDVIIARFLLAVPSHHETLLEKVYDEFNLVYMATGDQLLFLFAFL